MSAKHKRAPAPHRRGFLRAVAEGVYVGLAGFGLAALILLIVDGGWS